MNFNELIEKAKAGDAQSQYDLAQMYEYGEADIEPNDDEALKWYETLSDAGYREGNWGTVRVLIRKGHKAKNHAILLETKKKVIDEGAGTELYNKALELEVENKFDKAFEILTEASEKGCSMATYKIALYYGSGEYVKYDFVKEIEYLHAAAEAGLAAAMFRLAIDYEQGDDGDAVDIDRAILWFERSIKSGEPNAKGRLKRAIEKKERLEASVE